MDVESGDHPGDALAWLVHAQQFEHGVPERLAALVEAHQRHLRHRVLQHPGTDRMSFGVVGVQQALSRCPGDYLGQLPSQVDGILHARVQALTALRAMHVCGIAGEQHASRPIGRGLAGHVGESGDPVGAVRPEVAPVGGHESLAQILQGGFGGVFDVLL